MSKTKTSWAELNFIQRKTIHISSVKDMKGIPKWLEFENSKPEFQWVANANAITMDFGGVFHSIFLRWAVTINGLHVATEKYKSNEWLKSKKSFTVTGIRNSLDGSGPRLEHVRVWDGDMASKVHESSIPMLSAWAFCNMYSCLEEFIFKLFKTYLEEHPLIICRGNEFKELRKLYQNRTSSTQNNLEWKEQWEKRLDNWHRKKLYDGIANVFNNFIQQSGLKIPSGYQGNYDYNDISKTLGGISMIRNCFIHGVTEVPQELSDFCDSFHGILFKFKAGEKFELTLHELATLEFFTDIFTQALNTSFFELIHPELSLTNRSTGTPNGAR